MLLISYIIQKNLIIVSALLVFILLLYIFAKEVQKPNKSSYRNRAALKNASAKELESKAKLRRMIKEKEASACILQNLRTELLFCENTKEHLQLEANFIKRELLFKESKNKILSEQLVEAIEKLNSKKQ